MAPASPVPRGERPRTAAPDGTRASRAPERGDGRPADPPPATPAGVPAVRLAVGGPALLRDPLHNKSSAFSREERQAFDLEGLLPWAVNTMEQQARRAYESIVRKTDALEQHIGLAALHDRNEYLFYRVLADHLEEFLPIVYTPTVGRACQEFSHIFRQPRGLWITPAHCGRIDQVLGNVRRDDIRLIVVTDNERILGLGDQGAGGMGIPVGKLAVYSAAGIDPSQTLPVSLDVGTDNPALLADDLYLGWPHPRLRGEPYRALVDEFVTAVRRRFPRALLQWEDFKKQNAFELLERYRKVLPSFNDDIQGTGAAVLAGLTAATRITGIPLLEQRLVIVGAGAAGIGIARQVRDALGRAGLAGDRLRRAIALVDVDGVLVEGRQPLDRAQRPFAWPARLAADAGLPARHGLEVAVRAIRPTALIGVCGQPGAFTAPVVRAMAAAVPRPVIFALSNPTSQAEATPAELLAWTDGQALVATGSPFPPVTVGGRTIRTGQSNNAFVFPGLGLGALVAEAREISDGMCRAAADALAAQVSAEDLAAGSVFPPIGELRRVTRRIAEAVVREARDAGLGRAIPDDAVGGAVAAAIWEPCYPPLERVPLAAPDGR
ncbi:MAG TPA: NAD-dependent malic enzyme [Methylomirabilota bacterium]|nr:NAD-dependent malic enzyme [Methylomirabilota bacterium]